MSSNATAPSTPQKARRPRKKCPSPRATTSVAELQHLGKQSRLEFGKAARTRATYTSYVQRGKEFLAQLIAKHHDVAADKKDDVDTDLLADAFENPPNAYSATALEFFLVEKCIREGCSRSTAEGIQAAFADYWDHMDGDKYAGEYRGYDEDRNRVVGCPARSRAIRGMLRVIKNKNGIRGANTIRNHAEAMRVEQLARIMAWSEKVCPLADIEDLVSTDLAENMGANESGEVMLATMKRVSMLTIKHVLMRAFMSTAFTLWTRNFELCRLRGGDLTMGCISTGLIPYFKLTLVNRKGWQKSSEHDNDLQSQTYDIFQQDVYAIDMYTHLLRWIRLLERLLGCKIRVNDFVFPYFAPNGVPHRNRETLYERIQDHIDEFTSQAGLNEHFTTHCFRRGGAQYRFIFAPQRWSLERIRWWGGWAKGENTETLTRYLVDSLQSYESSHSDALCPVQREVAIGSGSDKLTKAVPALTKEEFYAELHVLGATIRDVKDTITSIKPISAFQQPVTSAALTHHHQPFTAPHQSESCSDALGQPLISTSVHPPIHLPQALVSWPSSTAAMPLRPAVFPPVPNSACQHHTAPGRNSLIPRQATAPLAVAQPVPPKSAPPGLRIDDLKRGEGGWLQAVHQWEVQAADGIPPLKAWEPEWYQGEMGPLFAAKRGQRQRIAEEFARFNCNREAFLKKYPVASKGVSLLLRKIREEHCLQRVSINGTPEERRNASASGTGHLSHHAANNGRVRHSPY